MAKLISILLHVLVLVVLAPCDPNDVYEYVGTAWDSDYNIGVTPKTPNGGITAACIEKFGKGSTATSIANVDEWNWIKSRLSADFKCINCTENYWIQGKYDTTVASDSLLAITVTGSTVGTKVYKRTNSFKYMCERPKTSTTTTTTTTTTAPSPYTPNTQDPPANPTPVQSCTNDNDVIVLLDSSGSIGPDNYKKEKLFAYDLARSFENQPTSRFGFTIFSSTVRKEAPLDHNLSAADLNSKILNADYMAYQTYTNLAIDSAVAEFAASTRTVTKNLVIITDGASNDPSATLTSIKNAISQGIRTFAVGIGSGTSNAELSALAGDNPKHLFTANNFDELTNLLNPLRQVVCEPTEK